MRTVGCGVLLVACVVAIGGCGASDAEVAKSEPIAQDMVRLMNEMASTVEKMMSDPNPVAAMKYAETIQKLTVDMKAKNDEFAKLPKNVQRILDAKYKPQVEAAEKKMKELDAKLKQMKK